MANNVDFVNVSEAGLKTSPFTKTLAGLRANEARYFKNKYNKDFVVISSAKSKEALNCLMNILKTERNISIASKALETARLINDKATFKMKKYTKISNNLNKVFNVRVFVIVFTLITCQKTLSQIQFGTYNIQNGENKEFKDNIYSTLIINNDNTFCYKHHPMSCWLWHESKGKWKIKGDTLVLRDRVRPYNPVVRLTNYIETGGKEICIVVRTKRGNPVQGVKVLCTFKNSTDTILGYTNTNGQLVIKTKNFITATGDAMNKNAKVATLQLIYLDKKGQEQVTMNSSDASADIDYEIDDDAKMEVVVRTIKFKIENSNLSYISSRLGKGEIFKEPEFGEGFIFK